MRKKRKMWKVLLFAVLLALLMPVCSCSGTGGKSGFRIYYLNEARNGLVDREYSLKSSNTDDRINEIIDQLSADSGDVDYGRLFPEDVRIEKFTLQYGILNIYFNSAYAELDKIEEVLCRGGIAQTFLQLADVKGVGFYVDNKPLTGSDGQPVGVMTDDSFADNPGKEMQNIEERNLTLYFASADGKSLTKEVQKVYYNSNTSVEKLVVERLIRGPQTKGSKATIPEGTQLINISVMDGACLVNFDEGFLAQNFGISEQVVIYSIVDSLTELPSVKTVQISVDGDTNRTYRDKYPLSKQYERNLSIVTQANSDITVVNEQTDKQGG